jgi:hypothetical protein
MRSAAAFQAEREPALSDPELAKGSRMGIWREAAVLSTRARFLSPPVKARAFGMTP